MGIDFDSLWGQAKDKVTEALEQAAAIGVPAIQGSLEQWGADVLSQQAKETNKTLQQNIQTVVNSPSSPPGSFGAALNATFQNALWQNYGLYIVFGIIGVGIAGYIVLKK